MSISLIMVVFYSYKNLADEGTEKSINMVSQAVFQTVRMAMNTGDPAAVGEALQKSKTISGISSLNIAKSQAVIDFLV